jgi:hypothetical protein
MNAKDRFDGFMRLAEHRNLRAATRQSYEWRVTLGLWAVIAAATIYLKAYSVPLWVGIVVILVHAFFWLRPVYVAHWSDNEAAAFYVEKAQSILNPGHKNWVPAEKGDLTPWQRWLGFLGEWGCLFQLITTIGLLYFFYLVTNPAALPSFLRA